MRYKSRAHLILYTRNGKYTHSIERPSGYRLCNVSWFFSRVFFPPYLGIFYRSFITESTAVERQNDRTRVRVVSEIDFGRYLNLDTRNPRAGRTFMFYYRLYTRAVLVCAHVIAAKRDRREDRRRFSRIVRCPSQKISYFQRIREIFSAFGTHADVLAGRARRRESWRHGGAK